MFAANSGYVTVTLRQFHLSGFNNQTYSVPFDQAYTYESLIYALIEALPPHVGKYLMEGRCRVILPQYGPVNEFNWQYAVTPGTHLILVKAQVPSSIAGGAGAASAYGSPYSSAGGLYGGGAGAYVPGAYGGAGMAGAGMTGAGGAGVPRTMMNGMPGSMAGGMAGGMGAAGMAGRVPSMTGASGFNRRRSRGSSFSEWLLS